MIFDPFATPATGYQQCPVCELRRPLSVAFSMCQECEGWCCSHCRILAGTVPRPDGTAWPLYRCPDCKAP